MSDARFKPEVVTGLNSELNAIRELEKATSGVMGRFNEEVDRTTQEWDKAFRIRKENAGYRFLGNNHLLRAVEALPEALEDRVRLSQRVLDFATKINEVITTRTDGSRVGGSINPLAENYVGDHDDLPALFLMTNGAMLGRVIGVEYSEGLHKYRKDPAPNLDPLEAGIWPHQTDVKVFRDELDPEGIGFLFSSAILVGGDKNNYVLPDVGEYSPPLEPAID